MHDRYFRCHATRLTNHFARSSQSAASPVMHDESPPPNVSFLGSHERASA